MISLSPFVLIVSLEQRMFSIEINSLLRYSGRSVAWAKLTSGNF